MNQYYQKLRLALRKYGDKNHPQAKKLIYKKEKKESQE